MPDPNWSVQYTTNQTPEQQGFTRKFNSGIEPSIVLVTGGNPSLRRIEVNTDNGGDVAFLTTNVPAFNSTVGFTAEMLVSVVGPGDAGFEATFLDMFVGLNIFQNKAVLERLSLGSIEVATPPNNVEVLWRATFDGSMIRIYRAGALVIGPVTPAFSNPPFQQFQFWAEGGGTVVFKTMKYYIAGAVEPG